MELYIIEAVSIWNAMENYEWGKSLSDSDSKFKMQRAGKLTGYSHDSLSKAKYVLENGNEKERGELKTGKGVRTDLVPNGTKIDTRIRVKFRKV